MLLAAAGDTQAATVSLPPFQVDPALLGLPPAAGSSPLPAAAVAPATAATPEPPAPASAAKPQAMPVEHPSSVARSTAAPLKPLLSGSAAQPKLAPGKQPVYLTADRIEGTTSVETVAQGNVDLQSGDRTVQADRMVYREPLDEAEATGNVKLTSPGESIAGPHMKLKLGDSIGTFDSPAYSIHGMTHIDPGATAHGTATRLDFEGKEKYRLADATYTTCPANGSDPAWYARISDLSMDYTASRGIGKGTTVVFEGIPILYSPWLSFTLDNQRKSGLLAPTVGSTSKTGLEVTTPFYWNIAPDMDATIAPRVMGKRGTQWSGEYRYLEPGYSGQISGEYLGNDEITHTNRSALTILHNQDFGNGFTGSLNLNKVSDDTYFTDLSTRLSNITQTNLLREGRLNYGGGGWWSASLMAQRFQTLQDPSQPRVAIPYDRLPQFLVSADRPDMPLGTDMIFSGEYVSFSNPAGGMVEGKRTTLYPQIAYPMQTAAFYVTPKVGFHSTHYQLSQQAAGVPDQISVNVPILSVDSGVQFERPLQLFSQELTQTLEPRAYYLRVPKRDQSQIPIFDTGLADFNFAQIFSENVYTGGDRVPDANQLTLAATSRLIDTASGEELMRGALGQLYYFTDQTVTLPGVAPRSRTLSDTVAALSGKVTHDLSIDSGIEYNFQDQNLQRLNLGLRYQPEPGKVLNTGYRYTNALLRQVDTSAQWPLFGGWHGVARYNYSFRDKRAIETIGGLEYDGGCWAARFVLQRLAIAAGQASSSIFIQLELNGFSSIGSNPNDVLKRNIPGYGRITNTPADPVFAK